MTGLCFTDMACIYFFKKNAPPIKRFDLIVIFLPTDSFDPLSLTKGLTEKWLDLVGNYLIREYVRSPRLGTDILLVHSALTQQVTSSINSNSNF